MDNAALFFPIFNLSRHFPFLDTLMIFGAKYLIFITFFLILIMALKGGVQERKSVRVTIFGLIIAWVLILLIRIFYFEPRPFVTFPISPLIEHAADASFPSVHTTIMAVLTFSYFFYQSKFAPFFLIFLLWVGFARIYVGVHYPLDILGGIITGFISVKIAREIKNFLKR